MNHIAIDVGDFNTNSGLARDDINDAHIGTLDRIRDVALQGGDFFHLDGRAEFNFVTRDGGATSKAGDLSINTEFIEHAGQCSNDGVVGLGTLLGWFTLVEQVLGRQAVRLGVARTSSWSRRRSCWRRGCRSGRTLSSSCRGLSCSNIGQTDFDRGVIGADDEIFDGFVDFLFRLVGTSDDRGIKGAIAVGVDLKFRLDLFVASKK